MSKQPEHNSERSQSQEPRCFARQHMTIEEFGLYTHARELSYKSKKFYLNARRCAKRFATTGKNTVYRLVASLEAKGWFQLLKEGRGVATQYLVLNHDEWAAVHPGECPETGTVDEVSQNEDSASVPETGLGCPDSGTEVSSFQDGVSQFRDLVGNRRELSVEGKESKARKKSKRSQVSQNRDSPPLAEEFEPVCSECGADLFPEEEELCSDCRAELARQFEGGDP